MMLGQGGGVPSSPGEGQEAWSTPSAYIHSDSPAGLRTRVDLPSLPEATSALYRHRTTQDARSHSLWEFFTPSAGWAGEEALALLRPGSAELPAG